MARPTPAPQLGADPPRPHKLFLMISSGLLALWLVFLTAMAVWG